MGRDGRGVKAASASSIQITFTYQGVECRERLKLQPTAANLKRAEQHRSAILHAIEQGTFDYSVTFPESKNRFRFVKSPEALRSTQHYLEGWIEAKRRQIKASTWVEYDRVVRHMLIPKFGTTPLAELTRAQVKSWLVTLEVTNKRLANIQSVLRSALHDAVIDEILDVNPLANYTYKNRETLKEDDDVDPFTADEQRIILEKAEGQFRNLIQFALWTGLRTSELVGLDWDDVDLAGGVLRISRVKTQKSKEFEPPKTKGSARTLRLLTGAREALVAQKQHTLLKGAEVFQDPRHLERWKGDQPIRNMWLKLLTVAEVRYRRPYQTRHTFASMMLSTGEDPWWVANYMGHTDTNMIRRRYGRWMPDAAPEAGRRADALFRSTS